MNIARRLRKTEQYLFERYDIDGDINALLLEAAAEIDRLHAIIREVDADVRHHLRSEEIAPALIQPDCIRQVRKVVSELSVGSQSYQDRKLNT